MRILVTGSAGFIGSHLVDALLAQGHTVVGVDNYVSGKKSNLAAALNNPRFEMLEMDIAHLGTSDIRGCHAVLHQAACKKTLSLYDEERDLRTNALGTLRLLKLSALVGVRRFLHASTGSVYGEPAYFPQDEDHPLKPVSAYGISKLAGESYIRLLAPSLGVQATVLRYFHVYGPRQDCSSYGGVVGIFCRQALKGEPFTVHGDGTQTRSFTYVGDVVRANLWALEHEAAIGKVYNVASGVQVTIQQLADRLAVLCSSHSASVLYDDWTPGDIKTFAVSNERIRWAGFEFLTSFESGLAETLDWYRAYLGGGGD